MIFASCTTYIYTGTWCCSDTVKVIQYTGTCISKNDCYYYRYTVLLSNNSVINQYQYYLINFKSSWLVYGTYICKRILSLNYVI